VLRVNVMAARHLKSSWSVLQLTDIKFFFVGAYVFLSLLGEGAAKLRDFDRTYLSILS